ncbi:MAG TPA: hypothetical protein PKI93_05160 [Alphaproteobacteria bacterium]|nr:hypothetical protein [Alphaproteobacteria bacterium]HNS44196.1 hypothetical protein [Alphaproteobacteria bacterium]
MALRATLLLALALATVIPVTATAQTIGLNNARGEPSNVMPVLPKSDLTDTPEDKIPNEIGDKLYDRCLSKVPPHFTPDAHYNYCACTSAATVATMKMSELRGIQSQKSWKLGNKAFEKYVGEVVAPCLDMPVEDMEFMSCILYRGNDWRINRIPQYCKCVSVGVREHVKKFGESELMIEWGTPNKNYDSPLEALWNSPEYNRNKNDVRERCIGYYMRYDPFTGGQ